MQKPEEEFKKITIQMTSKQATKIKEMAKLNRQSISAYIRNNLFSKKPNYAEEEFYNSILQDMQCIKNELEIIDIERLRKIES